MKVADRHRQKRELLPVGREAETCIAALRGEALPDALALTNHARCRCQVERGRLEPSAPSDPLGDSFQAGPWQTLPQGCSALIRVPARRGTRTIQHMHAQPHTEAMICSFISASTMLRVLQELQEEAAAQQPPENCSEPLTYQAVAFKKNLLTED